MTNGADPDQLASSEDKRSGYTVCKGWEFPGSAGQRFRQIYAVKHVTNKIENLG